MISFKGAHFPKDVILYAVFSTSGRVFLIVTLKLLWKKEVLKLTFHAQSLGYQLLIFLGFDG